MNPLLSIWLQPRKTMRDLIDNYDVKTVWLLAIIEGVKEAFNWAYSCKMGERHGIEFIEILVLIVGPFLGAANWVASWIARWVGEKFNGKGSFEAMFTACVWGSLPVIVIVPFWFLLILGFGENAFTPQMSVIANHSGNLQLVFLNYGWLFLKFVASIWGFIITLVGVSEAQSVTKWKAFGILLVAGLLTYAIFGLPIYFIFHL